MSRVGLEEEVDLWRARYIAIDPMLTELGRGALTRTIAAVKQLRPHPPKSMKLKTVSLSHKHKKMV